MACKSSTKLTLENEEILLRIFSDLLNVNKEMLEVDKAKQNIYSDILTQLVELTESTQEIANRMPYFD